MACWVYRGMTRGQWHEGLKELFRITKTPLPTKELSHAMFDGMTRSSGSGSGGTLSASPVLSLQQFEKALWLGESEGRRLRRQRGESQGRSDGPSASPDGRRLSSGPGERAAARSSLTSQVTHQPYLSLPVGRGGGQDDRDAERRVKGNKEEWAEVKREAWAAPATGTSRGRAAAFHVRSAPVSGLSSRPRPPASATQATWCEPGRSAPGSLLAAGMSLLLFFEPCRSADA